MSESTQKLSDAGVSIWLDDLSRERLTSGNLAELIKTHNVVGVTTNPTIFAGALSKGAAYAEQMRELAAAGADVEEAVFAATCDDVRNACDVFAPIYKSTNGFDGRVFEEMFSTERWARLQAHGANVQRPLWASTGVKDPSLPDTLYVTGLVAPNTVNTMPEATLNAVADHGEITGNTIVPNYSESNKVLDAIAERGISYTEVVEKLETEGLSKFDVSWEELLQTVREALDNAR